MTTRGAQNDIPCHHRSSLVILNTVDFVTTDGADFDTTDGAGGGVKDLEYLIGSPHWQPTVIPKEICAGRMSPKAYIEGCRRISQHFSGDMHPDDATGSVYHGSPVHISRDTDSSLTLT